LRIYSIGNNEIRRSLRFLKSSPIHQRPKSGSETIPFLIFPHIFVIEDFLAWMVYEALGWFYSDIIRSKKQLRPYLSSYHSVNMIHPFLKTIEEVKESRYSIRF